ncbi:MAG: carbohydrate ABC transporter permease [Anaerolineae bacterium]|nr:carbohydrate ABC transporter permease [Anaerolineae bacterium]
MATTQQTAGDFSRDRARQVTRAALSAISFAVLVLFALAMILPFVFSVANSFKTLPDINKNPQRLLPTDVDGDGEIDFSFKGYEEVAAGDFPRWTLNSFIFAVVVMLAHILFDSLAGYALARLNFPGRDMLFLGILGTMMIPGIVLVIPRFLILKQLGMIGTLQGLVVPLMADAFGIFMMKQFFESIPTEIEEAAKVDGANRFTTFFRVVLPMATPALTALAIFGFQGAWNDFLNPLIVVGAGDKSLWTLPLGLALLRGQSGSQFRWDTFLAGSIVTTVPMAIVFFLFQRYFVEGVSYSGLKG